MSDHLVRFIWHYTSSLWWNMMMAESCCGNDLLFKRDRNTDTGHDTWLVSDPSCRDTGFESRVPLGTTRVVRSSVPVRVGSGNPTSISMYFCTSEPLPWVSTLLFLQVKYLSLCLPPKWICFRLPQCLTPCLIDDIPDKLLRSSDQGKLLWSQELTAKRETASQDSRRCGSGGRWGPISCIIRPPFLLDPMPNGIKCILAQTC